MQPLHWTLLIDKSDIVAPIILLLFIILTNWVEGRPAAPKQLCDEQDRELIKFLGGKHKEPV